MICKICNQLPARAKGMCSRCYQHKRKSELPKVRIVDGFKVDSNDKLLYDERIHFNQGKPWTDEELEYICKFFGHDTLRDLSYGLGRTERTISNKISQMRREGLYETYRERYMQRLEEPKEEKQWI